MKKITAILISVMLLAVAVLPLTAAAWGEPKLMLAAAYDETSDTITVQYRVLEFAGTESADFRLKYNPAIVKLTNHEATDLSDDIVTEIEEIPDSDGLIAIQFIDMYHVDEEDCEEDGSATVATLTFSVINDNAEDAVFIATAGSYNMDPNSVEIFPERATLKIMLNQGSTSASTLEGYDAHAILTENNDELESKLTKVIIAAAVTAIVLIAGIIAIVVKYRKK